MISDLLDLPVTGSYLRRIDAETVNFKLATITEMVNGYPKVIGRVRFTEEGETISWGKCDKPSEAEAVGIREEFASAEFPKIITLSAISDPPPKCNINDKQVFVCHDFDEQIIMVHQRYENQDGSKGFLPWTKWSDGKWRRMEPDVMPFFGLPGAKEHSTLFLHEGSKAARRVKDILSGEGEVGRFPWMEEMRWGAHIGWIGGVHALARSDWRKLATMGWKRVIVIADNDTKGKAVLPEIAAHFRCPTFALVFTDSWPDSFDLGDEWPDALFGDEEQYIGPPFSQCLQPATYATDEYEIPPEGNGKPKKVHEIREEFAAQWSWVEKQDMMVNIDMPQYRMSSGHFNAFIRPFSHIKETLGLFHRFYSGNQMELTYDPSIEGTIVRTAGGLQAINLYAPGPIRPAPGDWTPWLEFLEYMFPVERDRESVKRWCATLVSRPQTRMIFGILLMSEHQGIGKGTLARVMADLVGYDNSSFPSASMIVESQFNGWISGKRLIVVDEIYEGHSWRAYNRLKPYVTDDKIEVNVKHQATWSMPNWTHYILMSNSRVALKIEQSDRRWLIPEVTEVPWSEEQFVTLYTWLRNGGLSTIAMWAKTFVDRKEGRYVRAGETAPMSMTKMKLIEESESEAERRLTDVAEIMNEADHAIAVSLTDLKAWAVDQIKDKVYETPQAMGRFLRGKGLWLTKDRIKIGGTRQTLAVNNEEMVTWDGAKLRAALRQPSELIQAPM